MEGYLIYGALFTDCVFYLFAGEPFTPLHFLKKKPMEISKKKSTVITTTPKELRRIADLMEIKAKSIKWGDSRHIETLTDGNFAIEFCITNEYCTNLKS